MYGNEKDHAIVTAICKVLNEKGITDIDAYGEHVPYSSTCGFGKGLLYMPSENLEKMVNCELPDTNDFSKIYYAWAREGALKFTPYISDANENPTLVVRYNRYISMFRGYFFQASGTIEGYGDYGHSSYRTDYLTHSNGSKGILRCGMISYMLWWAGLIDVGFTFRNFEELFYTDISIIDEFVNRSSRYWRRGYNYHWSDVAKYISISNDEIDTRFRTPMQLRNDKGIMAYIAIGKKTVQVQTSKRLVTITVPAFEIGSGYDLSNEDDRWSMEDEIELLENNNYLEAIATMAASLAGIHMSFTGFYWTSKAGKALRPINAPNVKTISDANGIWKITPDDM